MIARINHTKRVRIQKEKIASWTSSVNGRLHAEIEIHLPASVQEFPGTVWVEIERGRELQRFNAGRATEMVRLGPLDLSAFGDDVGLKLNVKVVDDNDPEHRLLALARGVKIGQSPAGAGRVPLLPVRKARLDGVAWRVEANFDSGPWLEISDRIEDWRSFAMSDHFLVLALPGAVRDVLTRLLIAERYEPSGDDDSARGRWLRFAESCAGGQPVPKSDDPAEVLEWIEDAVSGFASDNDLVGRLEGLVSQEDGE
jgi:hypothetical protein